MAPATAHSAAPTANTSVNSSLTLTPIAVAISRLEAPARTRMPTRVFATSRYSNTATASPTPMTTRR